MFCVKCGNEIPDGSAFCPKCGNVVRKPEEAGAAGRPSEPSGEAEGAQPPDAAEPGGQEGSEPAAKPKRKKKAIAIVAACLVVVVAAGVGVWWHFAHTPHLVTVQVDAPGLGEDSTPVPVEVSGTDASGGSVHEWRFVRPGASDVEVMPGSYDFAFSAGYVTGDAHVAVPTGTTQHLEVGLFDDEQIWLSETVAYKTLEDDEVGDDQFALITECVGQNPDDNGKAEWLCRKAKEHGDFMRKAKANAEGFLMSVFDTENNVAKGRSVSQFVTKGKYIQSGSYASKVEQLTVTMESDSTMSYSLKYSTKMPNGSTLRNDAKGRLGIASDGKVDAWYGEGSTRNSLYG